MALRLRLRPYLVPFYVSALLPWTTGCDLSDGYVEREEKRFTVTGKPEIDLSNVDGAIELRSWDRPEILVVLEKRARDKQATAAIEVRAEQNGNRIVVDVKRPQFDGLFFDAASVRLIVSLPEVSDVHARSGDGSIVAERLSGSIDLQTGDGSIRARTLSGAVKAGAGDGSIDLDDIDGRVDVAAGDGSIRVAGKLTSVRAHTGDGSVTVHVAPGSAPDADWDVATGDGSVRLELPDGFGADLDARAGDGSVHLQGITLSSRTGEMARNAARGRIGEGGRTIRVRTGDGSVIVWLF